MRDLSLVCENYNTGDNREVVGFGELRRLSLLWHRDVGSVERVYALDWLLKGIFDSEELTAELALTDDSALSKAHFADYPPVEDADFSFVWGSEHADFEKQLNEAAETASGASGLSFKLHSVTGREARVEYSGPLGRRSAAQPLLVLRLHSEQPRLPVVIRRLLHPFTEAFDSTVHAISLEELAAARVATLGQSPRARDVFDLWFILTRGTEALDIRVVNKLAHEIAAEKHITLTAGLNPNYRPIIARAWGNALRTLPVPPEFDRVNTALDSALTQILGS